MTYIPATKGYEVSRFEVNAFMRALGLDPKQVDHLRIQDNRAIATLLDGDAIAIPIKETRKP